MLYLKQILYIYIFKTNNLGGLQLGTDGEGNAGYYLKGDDTFIPFKKTLRILTVGTYAGERYSYSNSKTTDIKALLPDVYQTLTVDNFALTNVRTNMATGDEKNQSADCSIAPLSYDSSTGILTVNMTGYRGSTRQLWASSVTVKCFYVG